MARFSVPGGSAAGAAPGGGTVDPPSGSTSIGSEDAPVARALSPRALRKPDPEFPRDARRRRGLTQLQLAARAEVSIQTVSIAERTGHLTVASAAKLAVVLGVPAKEIGAMTAEVARVVAHAGEAFRSPWPSPSPDWS